MKGIKKAMNPWGRQKGFTLIELIIVMAILSILAAIALPRYAGVRDAAALKADAATATSIISAARMQELNSGKTTTLTATDSLLNKSMMTPISPQTSIPDSAITGTEWSAFAATSEEAPEAGKWVLEVSSGGSGKYIVKFKPTIGTYKDYTVTVTEEVLFDINNKGHVAPPGSEG